MSDHAQPPDASPGTAWLARRTGRRPEELTGSPSAAVAALADALREVTALSARLESRDPAVQAAAQAEADELRAQIAAAPAPGETFGKRVAQILRDAAARIDSDEAPGPGTPPC
jgi:hypothetical protein